MAYKEISELNMSEGVHTLFQYVAEIEPIFFPLTLFVIYLIIAFGSFFAQREFTGKGNIISSFVIAGFITTLVAFVLNLIPGLVHTLTMVICFLVFLLSLVIWFLSTKRR